MNGRTLLRSLAATRSDKIQKSEEIEILHVWHTCTPHSMLLSNKHYTFCLADTVATESRRRVGPSRIVDFSELRSQSIGRSLCMINVTRGLTIRHFRGEATQDAV